MFSQKKPYSAVTVTVERLTDEAYEEDDLSGIPDLVEVIKLQASGPAEAARAIRKKLKYGNVHRQIRALVLLDGLIQNAGPRFQRTFADEPLLERLRVCGTSDLSDPAVKKKCSELFRSWAAEYKSTPGMERVARLYRELPQRKRVVTQAQSRVVQETENPFDGDEDEEVAKPAAAEAPAAAAAASSSSASPPPDLSTAISSTRAKAAAAMAALSTPSPESTKKKKDKDKHSKKSRKPFNLEAEKGLIKATIADASIATTDLMNSLQSINREHERISENALAVQRFEACKVLRRKVLRYIYLVDSEDWLGSLLHANDELVTALMTFEQLDRSIDADSDSEDDMAEQAHRYRMMAEKGKKPASPTSPTAELASLGLHDPPALALAAALPPPQPPRPARPSAPPPRPSAMSKPALTRSPPAIPATVASPGRRRPPPTQDDSDGGDSYEDNDEDDNDPFADHHAV